MINCKRCDIPITFDDGICLNASTGMPHSIRSCTTKRGYVYCPECRESFSQKNACKHYREYGYSPGDSETFIMSLIQEHYVKGSFFDRKRKRKTSFDKLKNSQKECNHCNKIFAKNATREDTDSHEKECILQSKLI